MTIIYRPLSAPYYVTSCRPTLTYLLCKYLWSLYRESPGIREYMDNVLSWKAKDIQGHAPPAAPPP